MKKKSIAQSKKKKKAGLKEVQFERLRPSQFEAAARAFPVVYVPFGLIEWHGRHLPLGTDALKAHAILVRCAQQYGGIVYPPLYFPSAGWNNGKLKPGDLRDCVPLVSGLFERLKLAGFRVIIGVSGHNIKEQILMVNEALEPVMADGTVAGGGFWEFNLSEGKDASSDHAAKWETSDMLHSYPDLVDLKALGQGPLAPNMKAPDGIGGLDPRLHASAKIGKRKMELCAEAIGRRAQKFLRSLPARERGFRLKAVSPEYWWQV
jgi:creatinine amidohydrolase